MSECNIKILIKMEGFAAVVFDCSDRCHYCGEYFRLWRRRHHCRTCGSSVCQDHSYLKTPGYPESRVCLVVHSVVCKKKADTKRNETNYIADLASLLARVQDSQVK